MVFPRAEWKEPLKAETKAFERAAPMVCRLVVKRDELSVVCLDGRWAA